MKKTISITIFVAALIASSFTNCSETGKRGAQHKVIEDEYKATESKERNRDKVAETRRINEITKRRDSASRHFAETKFERELREAQGIQYAIARQANTKKTSKK